MSDRELGSGVVGCRGEGRDDELDLGAREDGRGRVEWESRVWVLEERDERLVREVVRGELEDELAAVQREVAGEESRDRS